MNQVGLKLLMDFVQLLHRLPRPEGHFCCFESRQILDFRIVATVYPHLMSALPEQIDFSIDHRILATPIQVAVVRNENFHPEIASVISER